MQTPDCIRTRFLRRALVSSALLATATAWSQSTPPVAAAAAEDTIQLSPFTVSTEKDVGYVTGSSGMGGRLNQPLEDTAASISVLNQEFIQDMAITSLTEAYEWAPNVTNAYRDEPTPFNDYVANIRNLGGSYQASKNFFRYYINPDSWFTERMDFGRGPNSIVFGDTGVAGAFNVSSKRAKWKPATRVETQFFSTGGYRAGIDVNRPVNKKFAVRFNAAYQNSDGWQDHEHTKFNGAALSFTYRPFQKTTLWGEVEYSIRHSTMASGAVDQVSNWDGVTIVTAPMTAAPVNTTGVGRNSSSRFVYDTGNAAAGVQDWINLGTTNGTTARLAPAGWEAPSRWIDPSLMRRPMPSIPSFGWNANYDDPNFTNRFRAITFAWEQQYTPNFYSEVALMKGWLQSDNNIQVYRTRNVYVDVNKVLPNGQANPNFMKYYTEQDSRGEHQFREPLEGRASLVYVNEAWRWVEPRALIGANYRDDRFIIRRYRYVWTRGTNPDLSNSVNLLYFRRYLDQFDTSPFRVPEGGTMAETSLDSGQQWIWRQQVAYNGLLNLKWLESRKLLTSFGYREEKITNRVKDPNYDPVAKTFTAFNPDYRMTFSGRIRNKNYSGIYKLTKWISVTASAAESFEYGNPGRTNIYGGALPVAGGKGWEIGTRLNFLDGKVHANLTYYSNTRTNLGLSGQSSNINTIWTNLREANLSTTTEVPSYTDTENYRAIGREIEVIANPTRSITLSANYSTGTAINAIGYPDTRAYYNANLATWNDALAKLTAAGDTTRVTAVTSALNTIKSTIEGYQTGRIRPDNYKYTANFTARYQFRNGPVKGLALNAGANFRGQRLVGNENGRPFDYIWGGGYTTWSAGTSYSWKLRDGTMRLQFNVFNLFDRQAPTLSSNGTITSFVYTTAAGVRTTYYGPRWYTVEAPRTFRLTLGYSF